MKLATALLCLSITAASAQTVAPFTETPTILTQYDKATGEIAGTTTIVDGKAYLRDRHGEHYATLIIDKDGTRRMLDPQGRPIDAAKIKERLEQVK